MEERINILIGSDINYAPYYGVMLTSLFMNNKESRFDVYLLTDDTWIEEETKRFSQLCSMYDSNFYVFVVNVDLVKEFPRAGHITLPTYYRLQACNILPSTIHKILYLDGDMIVTGDIRPLWNTNLDGYAYAGVLGASYMNSDNYVRLGYDCQYGYYNAGVMLYNFDFWREQNVSSKLIELISSDPEMFIWMDQDAINKLLHRNAYQLLPRYNLQTMFFARNLWEDYHENMKHLLISEAEHDIIIHYNGHLKPWQDSYYGFPYRQLWMKYNKNSLWERVLSHKLSLKHIKHVVKQIFRKSIFIDRFNRNYVNEVRKYCEL